MSKATDAEISISERPISPGPRRLAEWLNPTGTKKVHSLVDKVYKIGLVNLIYLIPSIKPEEKILMKARCGKTARRV
jgi:hypothetical protein